jgi:hypothetical protein
MDPAAHPVLAILLPALGACVVAVLATVVVERLGGVAGGILSTVPTTIVPAAIGLHASAADDEAFRCAMCFVPVGILLNAGYLLLWRIIPARIGMRSHRHLLATTVTLALAAWLAAASAAVWAHHAWAPDAGQSLAIGLAAFVAGALLGIAANRVPHPAPAGRRRVGPAVLALRGVAAGAAIAVALVLARSGDPIAGGIASVFPAIFTAIMVATWLAQGAQVPTGAVGPMMLGTLSVSAYALLSAALIPRLGVVAGSAACWAAAVLFVNVPAYAWLRRVRARHDRRAAAAGAGAP